MGSPDDRYCFPYPTGLAYLMVVIKAYEYRKQPTYVNAGNTITFMTVFHH